MILKPISPTTRRWIALGFGAVAMAWFFVYAMVYNHWRSEAIGMNLLESLIIGVGNAGIMYWILRKLVVR